MQKKILEKEFVDKLSVEQINRIAGILKELGNERVDLVIYNDDPETFIKNALAPAKDPIVSIKEGEGNEALAIVTDDNLSLANFQYIYIF